MYIHTVYIYTESTAAKAKYVKELLVSSKKNSAIISLSGRMEAKNGAPRLEVGRCIN